MGSKGVGSWRDTIRDVNCERERAVSDGSAEQTGQDHVDAIKISCEPELEYFSFSAEIQRGYDIIVAADSKLEMTDILGSKVPFNSAVNLKNLI